MIARKGESALTIEVQVQPKSSRDEIVGFEGERIRVRISAPPEVGKANERLKEVIAKALGISKSRVEIFRGEKSRIKVLRISGLSRGEFDSFVRSFIG